MKTAIDNSCPNVSVVMSVWSGDKVAQIDAATKSILSQTIVPHEFIIVVDGPVVDEIRVCLQFYSKHPSISVHYLIKNVGRGQARNYAIDRTSGEFVMLMDADDISRPDRLEKQLHHMRLHSLDILGGFIEEFYAVPGDIGERRIVPIDQARIVRMAPFRTPFNHVTSMYRKVFFNKVGGYRSLNFVEDWDFYLRAIYLGGRLGNMPVVLVDVRRAITRRRSAPYFREEIKVLVEAYLRDQIGIVLFLSSLCSRFLKACIPEMLFLLLYKFILRK